MVFWTYYTTFASLFFLSVHCQPKRERLRMHQFHKISRGTECEMRGNGNYRVPIITNRENGRINLGSVMLGVPFDV